MELLLNLAWLLLALPAYWLWRDRRSSTRRFSPWQFLLALGCMLVVLFPVISATDDLCAMRAELEEAPAGKHSIRPHSNDRLSASKWQTQPALASTSNFSFAADQGWHNTPTLHPSSLAAHAHLRPGRAPPRIVFG
jgi:hypothetical protein